MISSAKKFTLDQQQNPAARLCENIENQGYTNSQTCMGCRATMFTSHKDITNQIAMPKPKT